MVEWEWEWELDGDDGVSGRELCPGEWVWRGMMSCGISHLRWSESVICILSRSLVSKLWTDSNRSAKKKKKPKSPDPN